MLLCGGTKFKTYSNWFLYYPLATEMCNTSMAHNNVQKLFNMLNLETKNI